MNDASRDRLLINPLKQKLGIKMQNGMLIPVLSSNDTVSMAILLVDKFKVQKDGTKSADNKQLVKFTLGYQPWQS